MVDLGLRDDGKLDAFAVDVHQESSKCEAREGRSQFIMGHLHMLSMQLDLILSIDFRVEFLESSAVPVIDEDDLPEYIKTYLKWWRD
jgi:hypothetical protein